MAARLQGRTALVTGSTDGIGAAIAAALAADGAHVIVTGRDAVRGEKIAAGITESGGAATFTRADLASVAAIRDLADTARGIAGGPPDVLVNNAAMLIAPASTAEISEDLIDAALAVNVQILEPPGSHSGRRAHPGSRSGEPPCSTTSSSSGLYISTPSR